LIIAYFFMLSNNVKNYLNKEILKREF
jgi:hypothetical protein